MKTLYFDRSLPRGAAVQVLARLRRQAALGRCSPVHLAEAPEPALPGPRWVKVRNRECGLCGTDVHLILQDVNPLTFSASLPLPRRKYLGHEAVGEVVEVAEEAARPASVGASPYGGEPFAPGDRVALRIDWPSCYQMEIDPPCPQCARGAYILCERVGEKPLPAGTGGGFSEVMVCHRSQLYHVPDDVPPARAVLLEPAAVAVHAVLKRPAGSGARVLVVGAGSIGLLVVAALRALRPEADVHCIARHDFQAARAARMGAAVHATGSGLLEELVAASGARAARGMLGTRIMLGGFDLVVDTVGSPRSLSDSLRWTRAGGAVLALGAAFRPGRMDVSPLWHQEVELVGVDSHGVEADGRTSFDVAADLLARADFPADDLVTHRFPLERWREAVLAFTDKRASGAVKVVLGPQV